MLWRKGRNNNFLVSDLLDIGLIAGHSFVFLKVSFPDLENYDLDQAWPVILDNFVEWMREKQK